MVIRQAHSPVWTAPGAGNQFRMLPFELTYPGHFLDHPGTPQVDVHKAQILLHVLDSHLADAALALRLFEHERATRRLIGAGGRQPADVYQRRREMELERESQVVPGLPPEEWWAAYERIRFEVEVFLKRERWVAGEIPEAHLSRAIFLYAHAFLYALDGIGKTLTALGSAAWVPAAVTTARDDFYRNLPTLTDVRDTSHHLEDRARGLDRRGQALALKPVLNSAISAPSGALILNNLNGSRFGSTIGDGTFAEVDVSVESLDFARSAIQTCIDAFTWKPSKHHSPYR
jgi:hypothetical protein